MQQPEGATRDQALFASTASYYARYRPPYPAEALGYTTSGLRLEPGSTVLDLGCGTGQLAVPLARAGCRVWAVDPDPEMIAAGVGLEPDDVAGKIDWVTARAEELRAADLPVIRACTLGASFHWMDRDYVLRFLD